MRRDYKPTKQISTCKALKLILKVHVAHYVNPVPRIMAQVVYYVCAGVVCTFLGMYVLN